MIEVSYQALIAAACALRLEADATKHNQQRQDRLYEVADALLAVANGGGSLAMAEVQPECEHDYVFSRGCGVQVCTKCDDHKGLARCYCGWSKTSPGRGYDELTEMGEQIEEDY